MYLTHSDLSKYWAFDIETDDLKATRIWCAVFINAATRERIVATDHQSIRRFFEEHPDAILVGHNIISFDVPTCNRVLGLHIPYDRVVDTLTLSYLYDPRMLGGHSLEAWGERLGLAKIEFKDFSCLSDEMITYCIQDTELCLRVFKALTRRMRERGFSEKSAWIEHNIRQVVDEQQNNGFYFDIPAAEELYATLRERERGLAVPILELFPAVLVPAGTYNFRTRKDGTPYASYVRHTEQYPRLEMNDDGTYTVYAYQEFNIGSPKQRVDKLLSLGWEPDKFTPTGQPKVDEESLLKFADESNIPEVRLIADWLVTNGRGNMVNTWLDCVDRSDSRMHGRVFTCGAGTRRMTHSSPNTANIPKADPKVPWGKECRSLWTVPKGKVLVGYDAKALEMRMFAHYLGDPEVAKLYIEGDPHSANAAMLGIDRSTVKNVFYAFLYGAMDPKLGATAGKDRQWGEWARERLIKGTPGLEGLVRQIKTEYKTGFIKCIDGGYVRCPAEHAALNYKLQSAGGIVMKLASIFIRREVLRRGIDSKKVGDIHDEGQHEVDEKAGDEFGRLAVQAIRDAGEELNFSVPLDGDYKVGSSWAETH